MNLHDAWYTEFSRQADKDLQTMTGYLDDAEDEIWDLLDRLAAKDSEIYRLRGDSGWQKIQLRRYERELAAAKTWAGICRTIGHKLLEAVTQVCR